jgi:hypothetical protein
MNEANMIVYALTIHCRAATPPPSASPIGLIATLTTLTSNWTTPKPRLIATTVRNALRLEDITSTLRPKRFGR